MPEGVCGVWTTWIMLVQRLIKSSSEVHSWGGFWSHLVMWWLHLDWIYLWYYGIYLRYEMISGGYVVFAPIAAPKDDGEALRGISSSTTNHQPPPPPPPPEPLNDVTSLLHTSCYQCTVTSTCHIIISPRPLIPFVMFSYSNEYRYDRAMTVSCYSSVCFYNTTITVGLVINKTLTPLSRWG